MAFKISFIGAGYMTTEHLKAFKDIHNVEFEGIYSKTKSKAVELSKQYGIKNIFDNIDDLYTSTNSDAVIISVPELSLREVCEVVFKYPWISLIEKPVGYNLIDAEYILNLAKKNNAKVYVALNRRHYSSTRNILNKLNNINEKRVVNIFDQEDAISALKAGQPEIVVKNWMYANSIHMIDLFRVFCRGKIIHVNNILKWDANNPNIVLSEIKFESGDIGIYQAIWNAPAPWMLTISTPSARYEMRPMEYAYEQLAGSRQQIQLEVEDIDISYKAGIKKQAEEFIKVLNNQSYILPNLDEAFESMKLINNIYEI
jgi:predicted dehydrogenase